MATHCMYQCEKNNGIKKHPMFTVQGAILLILIPLEVRNNSVLTDVSLTVEK